MEFVNEFIKNKNRILNILDVYYGAETVVTQSGVNSYFIPGVGGLSAPALVTQAVSANQVRGFRFFLPMNFTVGRLTVECAAGAAGGRIGGAGIYNADGSSLLLSTTFDFSTTGVKTSTITAVTLTEGFYILAFTCNNANPTFTALDTNAGIWNTIMNNTTVNLGNAANSSSAGVLPSTTGSLTGSGTDFAVVALEGI